MSEPRPCPHCAALSPFADGFTCEACGRRWTEMEAPAPVTIPAGELTAKHVGRTIEIDGAFEFEIEGVVHEAVKTTIHHSFGALGVGHDRPVTILPEEADNA